MVIRTDAEIPVTKDALQFQIVVGGVNRKESLKDLQKELNRLGLWANKSWTKIEWNNWKDPKSDIVLVDKEDDGATTKRKGKERKLFFWYYVITVHDSKMIEAVKKRYKRVKWFEWIKKK